MVLIKQSTPKTTSVDKKRSKRLFARWIQVDGKPVCRWSLKKIDE